MGQSTAAPTEALAAALSASLALKPPTASKDSAGCCVICLDTPARYGALHGDSLHNCLCLGCSKALGVGGPCPVCRRPVQAFIAVFGA